MDEGFGNRRDRVCKIVNKRAVWLGGNCRLKVEGEMEGLEREANGGGEGIGPWDAGGDLAHRAIVQSEREARDESIDGL